MQKVILHESVTADDVWNVADNAHWFWWDEVEPAEGVPHEIMWYANVKESVIHYVEDDVTGIKYMVFKGEDTDALVATLTSGVRAYTKDELLKLVHGAKTPDDVSFAYYRLAIMAPVETDPEILHAFEQAFSSDDAAIRDMALGAASYIEWDKLTSLVRRLSTEDPDERVRETATLLLEAMEVTPAPNSGFEGSAGS